jgi:Predicted integral membrane protein
LKNFFAELKRRKVYRVAVAYAVASWLLIQIATQVFPFFEIPNWAIRLVVLVLCLGFPVAVILAWIFDITPQGIRRTDEITPPITKSIGQTDIPEKSIAVLPFENLSDDKENEYFAAGVHDDILSTLAKVADLKVISRTSVQQFKSGARNLREIGQALGVAHILEGTARRVGSRVRVNAQLIDARTDAHIWSETFDRELTDLFSLQSELAQRITESLRANLTQRERTSLQAHSTRDVIAYELFLRARGLFHWAGSGFSHDKGAQALHLIREAVTRDPEFALAYALESRLHSELFWFGYDKSQARLEKAKTAADTALTLQPDLGEAHLANAFYYYYGFRRYGLAKAHVAAAVRAIPNSVDVLEAAAAIARREGEWTEAVSSAERARERDPRNLSVLWTLFETYLALRRYRDAEGAIADALPISRESYFFSLGRYSLELFEKGETTPIRTALRQIPKSFDPGGAVTTMALRTNLMARDFDEAERALMACEHEKLEDNGLSGVAGALDSYTIPKSWFAGLIARGRGDEATARREFEQARNIVSADVNESPEAAKSMAMLGLIECALGNKETALEHARRAEQLLPMSKDSFDGPFIATTAAAVKAQSGAHGPALDQLEKLIGVPNGPTPGTLRAEPEWDSLRTDPRFKKMLSRNA